MFNDVVKFLKLHLLNISTREDLSRRFIAGCGIEIGAMHFPLPVAPGATVKYVDVNSREDNIARHPEIDASKVVATDYIEDGFQLASFPDRSVDFLIANHVLEHSCNPFGTLQNWSRVLKEDGILFMSVPNCRKCFDNGRKLTSLQHLVEDALQATRDPEALRERNRDHYREWVEISLPNARLSNPLLPVPEGHEREEWIEELSSKGEEIHFHTFNYPLFKRMLLHYHSQIDPSLRLLRLYNGPTRFELIAILQKVEPGAGR